MSKINFYHLIHPHFAITHMEFHLILKTSPTREWYEGRAWNGTLGSYEGATSVSIFCIWHKVQCRVLLVQTVSRHLPKNPKVSSISQRTQTTTNLINIISVIKVYLYFDQYRSLASWHSCLLRILHFLPNCSIWFGCRENDVAAILRTYWKKVVNGIYKW